MQVLRKIYMSITMKYHHQKKNIGGRNYIEHKLMFSNDGIAAYTNEKYAKLKFEKYVSNTQQAIDIYIYQ